MNNGYSTGYFDIERGVGQGDPTSPYLFILCLELLAIYIRGEEQIQGIKVQTEIKLSMYADDMTVILSNIESLKKLLWVLEKFSEVSGLHINKLKTQAMWIGNSKHREDKPLDLTWCHILKITGVHFTYNKEIERELNFGKLLKKVENVLNLWRQRNLTLIGKTQILKTFALSQFLFITNVVYTPMYVIKEADQMFYKFLWEGPDKVKRAVMMKEHDEGGLKVPSLEMKIQTQRIMWIKRFVYGKKHPWKEYLETKLSKFGGQCILMSDLDTKCLQGFLSDFYYDMLVVWNKYQGPPHKRPLSEQSLWCNKNIVIGGKSIYFKELASKGINYVSDLYEDNMDTIMTWQVVKTEYGLSDLVMLKWNSLISSMPRSWKKISAEDRTLMICM